MITGLEEAVVMGGDGAWYYAAVADERMAN